MSSPARSARPAGQALYWQIAGILRGRILSGWHRAGDKLGSENELAQRFGVSRSTIRQALAELHESGLIESRQGAGTFVCATLDGGQSTDLHPGPMFTGFLDDLFLEGTWSDDKTIAQDTAIPDRELANLLDSKKPRKMVRITTVRTADGKPYGVGEDYFDPEIAARIPAEDEVRRTLLQRKAAAGLDPASNHQRIEPTTADARLARLLCIKKGDPLLCMTGVGRDSNGRALNVYRLWISKGYGIQLHLVRVGPVPDRLLAPGDTGST